MNAALDLLSFSPPGKSFIGRQGQQCHFRTEVRNAGSNLTLRKQITQRLIYASGQLPEFDVVVGIAKAGMIWGAWLAHDLGKPYATVIVDSTDGKPPIEGNVEGCRCVLVDNFVASAGTLRRAGNLLLKHGASAVNAIVVIQHDAAVPHIPMQAAFRLSELLHLSAQAGVITPEQLVTILAEENIKGSLIST